MALAPDVRGREERDDRATRPHDTGHLVACCIEILDVLEYLVVDDELEAAIGERKPAIDDLVDGSEPSRPEASTCSRESAPA